jgi:ankyrin repeat protein
MGNWHAVDVVTDNASRQHWDRVEAALQAGFGVDAAHSQTDDTILHHASTHGHLPTVLRALRHRANPNARNRQGCTPVWFAAYRGSAAVLAALLAAGGDVNAAPTSGMRPLLSLVMYGLGPDAQERMRLLLADPTLDIGATWQGLNAVEWGLERGHPALAAMVLQEVRACPRVCHILPVGPRCT